MSKMSKSYKSSSVKASKPKAIVLDIEGTTTDRHYVSKVLFPFIRRNFESFLSETYDSSETKEVIKKLRYRQQSGEYDGMPEVVVGSKAQVIKSVSQNIVWQMKKRLNGSELKQMELLCWVWAYDTNQIKAHVFEDVSYALHEWKVNKGIKIYVYSSAIVSAQKLLFVNTNHGNLCPLIERFFDSSIGEKRESESYKTIANSIDVNTSDILFITDEEKESDAAERAGLRVIIVKRPGNKSLSERANKYAVTSFAEIKF